MAVAGEDGRADPALSDALAGWRDDPGPASQARLHVQLVGARLLAPVVPLPPTEGRAAELSRPTLVDERGGVAALAFTGLESMHRWRADARPFVVTAATLFEAAAGAGQSVVIDIAGPVSYPLDGHLLSTLAAGFVPVAAAEQLAPQTVEGGLSVVGEPPAAAPGLEEALAGALAGEAVVAEAYLLAPEPGADESDVAIGLVLRADRTPSELVALVSRLAGALAAAPGVDHGLDIAVLTAEQRAAARSLGPPAYLARHPG